MKNVVITGSSRGIGFGLARAFLERGCRVAISGRDAERLGQARARLVSAFGEDAILAHLADVSEFEQVQSLWEESHRRFGTVDIWINNAGITADPDPLWQQAPETINAVYRTNLIGLTYGCLVALTGMRRQGYGAIYNLEGAGSDGRMHPGLTLYGTTKYAIRYLTDSLAKEVEGMGVIVGALRPGMVLTDLVTSPYADRPQEWERFKPVLNLIAERVENVAPLLVDKILKNRRNGARIRYLSNTAFLLRTLKRAIFREKILLEEGKE